MEHQSSVRSTPSTPVLTARTIGPNRQPGSAQKFTPSRQNTTNEELRQLLEQRRLASEGVGVRASTPPALTRPGFVRQPSGNRQQSMPAPQSPTSQSAMNLPISGHLGATRGGFANYTEVRQYSARALKPTPVQTGVVSAPVSHRPSLDSQRGGPPTFLHSGPTSPSAALSGPSSPRGELPTGMMPVLGRWSSVPDTRSTRTSMTSIGGRLSITSCEASAPSRPTRLSFSAAQDTRCSDDSALVAALEAKSSLEKAVAEKDGELEALKAALAAALQRLPPPASSSSSTAPSPPLESDQQGTTVQEVSLDDRGSSVAMIKRLEMAREDERRMLVLRQEELTKQLDNSKEENSQMRSEHERLRRDFQTLQDANADLQKRLDDSLAQLEAASTAADSSSVQASPESSPCSQGRLRAVMTKRGATSEELEQAILGVEALLDEAKREFNAQRLRERRAACEELHKAVQKMDEELLVHALGVAVRVGVENDDIEKGEAILKAIREMSGEEKRRKALNEIGRKKKEQAFLVIKRDDDQGLRDLLEGLEDGLRWQDWCDHGGRSLWKSSQFFNARQCQHVLAPLLGLKPPAPAIAEKAPSEAQPESVTSTAAGEWTTGNDSASETDLSGASPVEASSAVERDSVAAPLPRAVGRSDLPKLTPEQEAKLRPMMFKAVVQDDAQTLSEAIEQVSVEEWSVWKNKADKDLLELADERGSSEAYSVLARALGIVVDAKKDTFEEQECVWVFSEESMQPVRATILEDADETVDDILVEMWDDDAPPMRITRSLIHKSYA
eukprot:TRINITY_DN17937_c0_g1_i3.p1 TRINITY_DN17937_c0_g1~~TRINITY_DN17937_c0_g1_i3.p1  ORF type:complete len:786 (+),score=217.90 TRINITY_DN17937_c0_g1_i3:158-2515(+)